jgi:hypothetical protein
MVFLEGRVPAQPRNFRHLTTSDSDAAVANRQSPIAAVFGSAGISPSHFSMPHVPCPMFRLKLVVKAVAIPYLASRQLPVAIFRFTGALSL